MAELYKVDGVLWSGGLLPRPLCPTHRLELDPFSFQEEHPYTYDHLRCEECEEDYLIPRDIEAQKTYVRRKLESRNLKDLRVLNIDDEAIPIAETKVSSKDNQYFVKAILTESRVGKRVVIYAGKKGKKDKTQIFVEPEIKRLAFDQKDIHPTDIFSIVEATFVDGTKCSVKRESTESKKPKQA